MWRKGQTLGVDRKVLDKLEEVDRKVGGSSLAKLLIICFHTINADFSDNFCPKKWGQKHIVLTPTFQSRYVTSPL